MSGRWLRRLLATLALLIVVAAFGLGTHVRSTQATESCPYSGGGPPFRLQSFEADRDRELYLDTQKLAAINQLFPDDSAFSLPSLTNGSTRVESEQLTIPPQLLYAISWIESSTNQTAIHVPYGDLGPTLISFDCGYGIMQVTSSIVNDGGLPSRYESLVGAHFAYNIAAGARILAEKWNDPLYPIVGDHDPAYVESWYYALWAYNGWAGVNHPQHHSNNPSRPPYQCNGSRTGYPYQELVLGCVAHPPEVDGEPLWEPLPVALPDLTTLAATGGPLSLDTFHAGLDNIYIHPGGAAGPPFASMNMPLPIGAQRLNPPDVGSVESERVRLLGEPQAMLTTTEIELTSSQLQSGNVSLEIHNEGSGLLAWRVVDAPSWLNLDLQGGVALGIGYEFSEQPQSSALSISAAASGVPEGSHRGRITLEFEYPDGQTDVQSVAISLDKRGAAYYEAGRPQS